MMDVIESIKRLIRFGRVTKSGVNGRKYWTQQIQYLGKTSDCLFVFPYGMHANLPPDDVLALFFSIQGHSENRAGIGWTPSLRPDLESGEFALYHPFSNSIIVFRNNGDLDIDLVKDGSSNNLNINANNVNVTSQQNADVVVMGDVLLDVGGDIDATVGGNVTMDVAGDVDFIATSVTFDCNQFDTTASSNNLGTGGNAIARVGDQVQIIIPGGSSAGTYTGPIISGGANTSV